MLKARLYEHELKKREEKSSKESDSKTDIGWGYQIRSYVLQPYRLVKDLRYGIEDTNPNSVLNGNIDKFIEAWRGKTEVEDPEYYKKVRSKLPTTLDSIKTENKVFNIFDMQSPITNIGKIKYANYLNKKDNQKGRILPHSVEAEEAVLGCMLINTNAVPKAIQNLEKNSFYNTVHQILFVFQILVY